MQSFIHNNWKVYSNTVSPKLNTDDLARTFDTPPPYASIHNKSFVNKLIDNTTFNLFSKSTINKKSLTQGIKLVEFAVDEFESGNEALALDIYLSGLDKIIMALPSKNDKSPAYQPPLTCFCRFEKFENKTNNKRQASEVPEGKREYILICFMIA